MPFEYTQSLTTAVKMVGRSVDKKDEIRAYIKARSKLGCSLKKLMTEISTAFGPSCVSYDTVRRWKKIFESGVESIKNAPKSGRPKSASRKEIVSKIKEIIEGDRFTVRDIARKVGISLSTVYLILKKHLKGRKISAKWVLHLLTNEQKRQRVKWPKSCFKCFQNMTKSSLPMSSQVMKPGSIILSPSERLAIRSGPLNTANAQ